MPKSLRMSEKSSNFAGLFAERIRLEWQNALISDDKTQKKWGPRRKPSLWLFVVGRSEAQVAPKKLERRRKFLSFATLLPKRCLMV